MLHDDIHCITHAWKRNSFLVIDIKIHGHAGSICDNASLNCHQIAFRLISYRWRWGMHARLIGHGPTLLCLNRTRQFCPMYTHTRRPMIQSTHTTVVCASPKDDCNSTAQEETRGALSVLAYINESTKWVVSGIAFTILIGKRDESTAWCIIGGVISAIVCRTLKFVINASRPLNARKSDPGMPSSHASTLAFLSMYPSMMLLEHSSGVKVAMSNVALASGLIAGGVFLTSLRVVLGYHTWPQVVVGWCLGSFVAILWQYIGVSIVLPYLISHAVGRWGLTLTTCGFVALFAIKNVLRWVREER